jgi:hypothetical protein
VRDGGGVFYRWVWGAVCEWWIYGGGDYAASSSKPYELVGRAGEWDVVPEGVAYGVKGSGTEEDGEVDLVNGGVAAGTRKGRVRGKTRRRESKREVVPESVCSSKMQIPQLRRTVRREWARITARST